MQPGFFEHRRRRRGNVFAIPNATCFSTKWMEYADATTPERTTTRKGRQVPGRGGKGGRLQQENGRTSGEPERDG